MNERPTPVITVPIDRSQSYDSWLADAIRMMDAIGYPAVHLPCLSEATVHSVEVGYARALKRIERAGELCVCRKGEALFLLRVTTRGKRQP